MRPGTIKNQMGYGPDRFLPDLRTPSATGARRVASEVLKVLAIAEPFREGPAAGPSRGRQQDGSTSTGVRGRARRSVPTGQAELLGLLLDVLVVERGALGGVHLTGADLDADLLEVRALDRRLELQGRAHLARVEVGPGVLGHLRHVGRQRARLRHERSL